MSDTLATLTARLSAPDADVRIQTAEQLAQLGPDARAAALALVLACGDPVEEVRESAAAALEELGPPKPGDVDQLVAFLGGRSADVGYWAATLLGRLKGEAVDAVAALTRAISESSHAAVRQRAAWALGEIGPAAASALPALEKAAGDSDARLARLARQAVSQITAH